MLYSRKYKLKQPKTEPEQPPEPEDIAPSTTAPAPRALTIINEGNSPEELAILPTIGKGAGKAILEARPDDGYESLSELPSKIFAAPYNCSLDEIEAYTGE